MPDTDENGQPVVMVRLNHKNIKWLVGTIISLLIATGVISGVGNLNISDTAEAVQESST